VDLVDDDGIDRTERLARIEVRSRYSDSGVVIRISAGSLEPGASLCGVSPVESRSSMTNESPRALPPARCRSAGREVALHIHRQRLEATRTHAATARFRRLGANISRSRQERKAASVFPLPVGARIKVESPRAIAGQPSVCGRVADSNTLQNHSRTAGRKGWSGSIFARAVTLAIL
jgi:hypothetical protein